MRIQHNIMAMNAYRNYNNNTSALSKNLEKLSSGYKINRAGDDAAGLAISEKMRAQITGLKTATKNVKDGVSLVKTAEGAMQEVQDMLNRMVELATQSANGTYQNEVDRENLQLEVNKLSEEIDRIADSANFNGIKLLDGSLDAATTLTSSTYTMKAAASNKNAAIDVEMKMDHWTDKSGVKKPLKVTFAHNATTSQQGAVVDNKGETLTISLDATKGATAAQIKEMLANATIASQGTLTAEEKTSILEAVKGASVSGAGVTALKSATGIKSAANIAGTVNQGKALTLQIGDDAKKHNQMSVSVKDLHAKALKLDTVSVANQTGAQAAVKVIKDAINTVSSVRGELGATQNRLEHTQNNLSVMTENIQDAESTIRDTDVADEMMAYTKNNILVQSAQAMLAQANQVPQGVLQLLQ